MHQLLSVIILPRLGAFSTFYKQMYVKIYAARFRSADEVKSSQKQIRPMQFMLRQLGIVHTKQ